MIDFFKKLFGLPTAAEKEAAKQPEAPYKVETPAVQDFADIAIAQRPTPIAEKATEAVVASIEPVKKKAPKKTSAPKKQTNTKPRKPKAPKA